MKRRNEIDGLRAIAVLAVIFYHTGLRIFAGGFVGVDIFFVISGYLITFLITQELEQGSFKLIEFYERRGRRILPALGVVLLTNVFAAWFLLIPHYITDFGKSLISSCLMISNLHFYNSGKGYFETDNVLQPLLHTWSLSVEEQFYLCFPLLLILLWKFGKKTTTLTLTLLALASFSICQWKLGKYHRAVFYLLPTRLWEILLGSLLAILEPKIKHISNHRWKNEVFAFLGIALIVYSITQFNLETPNPGFWNLIPTLGTALIITQAYPNTILGKALSLPPLVFVGLLSYSLYLWHYSILSYGKHTLLFKSEPLPIITLLASSLILSYLTWRFVEQPIRQNKQIKIKPILIFTSLFTVAALIFTSVSKNTRGFLFRYPKTARKMLAPRVFSEYQKARSEDHLRIPFDFKTKNTKILLIGDSFARDIVNVICESKLHQHIQISTWHTSSKCGVLFIEDSIIAKKREWKVREECKNNGIFENPSLRTRMLESDEIWFASNWRTWTAELISESVANVKSFSHKPVLVFGQKEFGGLQNLKNLALLSANERMLKLHEVDRNKIAVNSTLEHSLPSNEFVNLLSILCNNDTHQCPMMANEDEMISVDHIHLTRAGASWIGNKLLKDPRFNKFVKRNTYRTISNSTGEQSYDN